MPGQFINSGINPGGKVFLINSNNSGGLQISIGSTPPTTTTTSTTTSTTTVPTTTTSTTTSTTTQLYFLLFEDGSIATAENNDNIEIDII
jgi:hypothetical protein